MEPPTTPHPAPGLQTIHPVGRVSSDGPPVGAAVAVLVGGALTIAGSFLGWLRVTTRLGLFQGLSGARVATGIHTTDGKVALAGGIVAALGGAAVLTARTRTAGTVAGTLSLLAAAAGAAAAAVFMATARSQTLDDAVSKFPTALQAGARDALQRLIDVGALRFSLGLGVVLALIGGAVAAIGAVVALVARGGAAPPTLGADPASQPPPIPVAPPGPDDR